MKNQINNRWLFRGICKSSKKFVYGSVWEYTPTNMPKRTMIRDNKCVDYEIDPTTIGQCTGLTDKNGTLIYEGDVVKCENWEYNEFYIFYSEHFQRLHLMPLSEGRLKNDYGRLGVHIFEWIHPEMSLEIIGNIHDNSVDSVSTT